MRRSGGSARTRHVAAVLTIAFILPAPRAAAEVVSASAGAFTTRASTQVVSVPLALYLAIATGIASWWNPDHSITGNAANLSLDARPGGCFCEAQPGGSPYRHLTVVEAERPRVVRLTGGLGPLATLGASGMLTWTFTERSGRTTVEVTYEVTGDPASRLDTIAPSVDEVLTDQLQRLKRFVESGRP